MNFGHFIAHRIAFSKSISFTKVIVRIAIAAIALSLATMILTTSIVQGFKKEISSKVFGFWGHIHITDTNINRTFEAVPIIKDQPYLEEIKEIGGLEYQLPASIMGNEVDGKYQMVETQGGVAHVQPFILSYGILSTSKEFGAIVLKGIDEDFDWEYLSDFVIKGRPVNLDDGESSELVISAVTARTMQIDTGQRVQVSFIRDNEQIKRAFKVVGIYNTGLEEYDKTIALCDMRKLQGIMGWSEDEVYGYEVFLDNIEDLDILNEYIYQEILPARLYSESIKTKFPSIFEWLKLTDINEDVMFWLMLIVAIINMITALLIFILERTHMIGVLKALGSKNWQVRKIFLYNAGYIILFGLIFGNILGLGIAAIQYFTHVIKLDEANYYLTYAPILFNWTSIILLNVLCFVIILIFLIIPTYLVTRIDPIKTLRFE